MTSPIPTDAKSKREALRQLLADGLWHHMSELRRVGGWRYGARLFELRQRDRGLVHERRGRENEFEYRAVWPVQTELGLAAQKVDTRTAALEREIAALRRRVAELESAAGVSA